MIFLVVLIGATFMVRRFFERGERKVARLNIKEIIKDNEINQIANETVSAVHSAILATIMSAVTASAAASAAGSH